MDTVMATTKTAGPTFDELVAHGWSPDQAHKLLENPEGLVAEMVKEGWPERDARIRVASPSFWFDLFAVDDDEGEPPSLEELVARDRAASR